MYKFKKETVLISLKKDFLLKYFYALMTEFRWFLRGLLLRRVVQELNKVLMAHFDIVMQCFIVQLVQKCAR